MSEEWGRYALLVQELDTVRATEQARTQGTRAAVAEMTGHADQLGTRLDVQRENLVRLAQDLRYRMPGAAPIEPEGLVEPSTDLAKAAAAIDRADELGRTAAERGRQPLLLPTWPAAGRTAIVYAAACVFILALQAASFVRNGSDTAGLPVLFGYPLIGFLLAYSTLRLGSATRVSATAPKVSVRLGIVVCFLVGPVALLLFGLFSLRN